LLNKVVSNQSDNLFYGMVLSKRPVLIEAFSKKKFL
jgi:hypothetical protein